ncbi:MAG: hypothetical protein KZQ88_14645 [Candidatus Thiodiazotropha sp. (ex Dulcina madagascariensis)]|nr:hypothetical protein [Candidatus Thiodiazotropha sp. (ex Dulcina madagascariensis)]MCU7928008.1 hypothetical protein [Candidatus Thiodiazotropha sp. (ex Dulcina madagascariensis)]
MCADESKDNPALRRLYQADQTDRQGFPKAEQQRGLLIERDRSRMYQGQPQRYGTQFVHNEETGRWELYRLDQQAVSDADRREHGIDLEQIQKTLEELNAASQ